MEPKGTSRARVWQKEWETMPWDNTRRTVLTETADATFQLENTRTQNKRSVRTERQNNYKAYYYGSEEEKTVRKSLLRQELKVQLDQTEKPRHAFAKDVTESQRFAEEDRQARMQAKEAEIKKKTFLSKFRDENKMLIEVHAAKRKAERQAERDADKKLLEHNPINWSHSLW